MTIVVMICCSNQSARERSGVVVFLLELSRWERRDRLLDVAPDRSSDMRGPAEV